MKYFLTLVSAWVWVLLAGNTQCFAVDPEKQIAVAESVVKMQVAMNSAAEEATLLLQGIFDENTALGKRTALSKSLRKLTSQITKLNQEMKVSKKFLSASRPKAPELAMRWDESQRQMAFHRNEWPRHVQAIGQGLKRLSEIHSLPVAFCKKIRVDAAEYELHLLGTLEWLGKSMPPQVLLDYFKKRIALLKRHGAMQVVDVTVDGGLLPKLKALEKELLAAAGDSPTILKQMGPIPGSVVTLTIAPVADFEALVRSITIGNVVNQDKNQGLIQLSSGQGQPASKKQYDSKDLDLALDLLTDGGTFVKSRGGFNPRKILERRGPDALIGFELRGMEKVPSGMDTLSAIWRNTDTGRFLFGASKGNKDIVRGYVQYDKSVQSFADQVDYGTVESVDKSKRRIVIAVDAAKISPEALLESIKSKGDLETEKTVRKLQATLRKETLDSLTRKENPSEFADSPSTKADKRLKQSKARRKKLADINQEFSDRKKRGASPRELRNFFKESLQSKKTSGAMTELQEAIADFVPPRRKSIPSAEEIAMLAEMLHLEDLGGHGDHNEAVAILLTLRPQDASNKKTIGRIAKGFKKLALEDAFGEGEYIRGLVIWGGKHSLPLLIELFHKSELSTPIEIYAAFVELDDPRGATAVANKLGDFHQHEEAVACLSLMGTTAEDVLIEVAPSDDPKVSLAAVELLGTVGTQKSLALLKRAIKSSNSDICEAAKAARKLIKERNSSEVLTP